MKRLTLFVSLICLSGVITAMSPDEIRQLWRSASDAYAREQYQEAADVYERIAGTTAPSAILYYNLGNCYYQLGQVPQAVLYYERAFKLKPSHKQIRENLELARRQIEDPVIPLPGFFLTRWVRQASWLSSPAGWGVLSLLFLWCSIGLFAFIILKDPPKKFLLLLWVSVACLVLTTLLGIVRYHDVRSDGHGVIMTEEQRLFVAPDAESAVVREIAGGERVTVLDSLETFLKVRLRNYEEGWVPMKCVERI